MNKYRQLCFWIAAVVATTSVGFAQKPPGQPAATPAQVPATSEAATPATPSDVSEPAQPDPNSRVTTTSKNSTSTQNANSSTDPAEPAQRIAIIELSPDTEKSEVIRQVVEILEKQGVAKQSARGTTSTTSLGGIEARIAARGDTRTEDVISLIKSLQGHGIVRMGFSKPSDNRNVVTVLAPADTPWPVIDNIRIMVTAKKLFAVDVQIAPPTQPKKTNNNERYYYSAKPGTKDAIAAPRYGYSAAGQRAAQQPKSNHSSRQAVRPVQYSEIFRLQFADASIIAEGVSQLFGKDFGIVADVRTNSVLVRGDESQLKEMKVLVEMLDRPQPKRLTEPPAAAGDSNVNVQRNGQRNRYTAFYVDVPSVASSETRIQIQELDRQTSKAAESLRWFLNGLKEPTTDHGKRKAELRKVVRKTFLARQELQRAELAEFAARLKRIQQSIEMRDKIADKIVDRRVEELLDPNLKWNHNETGGTQKTVVVNETVIQRQNGGTRLQPAPKQNSQTASNQTGDNQTVVVSQTSEGTVILRNAEEFRELLATHAKRVAQAKASNETWKQRYGKSKDEAVKREQEQRAKNLAQAEANRKFAMKEYETQIRLLQSEVESVHLVLETAKQELERAATLVEAKALPSHELDQRKREAIAAEQRLEKAKVLLDLYQDAATGI